MRFQRAFASLDRRVWFGTFGRVLFVLILINIGVVWQQKALERQRLANLLAPNSKTSRDTAQRPPRYDVSLGGELDRYLKHVPDARTNRLAYLVGMSQMYKINDPLPGDKTIVEHLDDKLATRARAFGLAAPNLDNEEALFLLLAVSSAPQTKPSSFIYALCFDKMRFVDVREGYLTFLRAHPEVQSAMASVATRYAAQYPLAAAKLRTTLGSLHAHAAEDEHSFEHGLRSALGRHIPLVRSRKDLNVVLTYGVLYGARNKLLGITNTTKRPMIPGRYDLNAQFLQMMIDVAHARDIQFIYYINPLNPQAENPYITSEYVAFKRWADSLARGANIPFANLENVVPETAWGLFMGGPDFKHFGGMGHELTADAIVGEFGAVITGSAPSRR